MKCSVGVYRSMRAYRVEYRNQKMFYFVVAKLFFLVSPIIVQLCRGFKNGLRLPDREGLGSYVFNYFLISH